MLVKMCIEVGVFVKYIEFVGIFKCLFFVSLLLIDLVSVEVVVDFVIRLVQLSQLYGGDGEDRYIFVFDVMELVC